MWPALVLKNDKLDWRNQKFRTKKRSSQMEQDDASRLYTFISQGWSFNIISNFKQVTKISFNLLICSDQWLFSLRSAPAFDCVGNIGGHFFIHWKKEYRFIQKLNRPWIVSTWITFELGRFSSRINRYFPLYHRRPMFRCVWGSLLLHILLDESHPLFSG